MSRNIYELHNRTNQIEHVKSLHDAHFWSLEGEHHVFTAHLKLENILDFNQIVEDKKTAKKILKKYHFTNYTIETEMDGESCELCELASNQA